MVADVLRTRVLRETPSAGSGTGGVPRMPYHVYRLKLETREIIDHAQLPDHQGSCRQCAVLREIMGDNEVIVMAPGVRRLHALPERAWGNGLVPSWA